MSLDRAPVDVDELRRGWHAVRAGEFRTPQRQARGHGRGQARVASAWSPEPWEEVVVVLGCAGSSGATTVSLAMGLSALSPVRVVECGSVTASGLAAASTAELGLHPDGRWLQGRRDRVLLERGSEVFCGPSTVPHPIPAQLLSNMGHERQGGSVSSYLTILDAGWDAGQLLIAGSWIAETVRTGDHLVLMTRATAPGMRRLEGVLDLLSGSRDLDHVKVAVIGPRRKKWPRGLEHAGGSGVRRVIDAGHCVEIPEIPALAVAGLDSRPLPVAVVDAACRLLPRHMQPDRDRTPTPGTEEGNSRWT